MVSQLLSRLAIFFSTGDLAQGSLSQQPLDRSPSLLDPENLYITASYEANLHVIWMLLVPLWSVARICLSGSVMKSLASSPTRDSALVA